MKAELKEHIAIDLGMNLAGTQGRGHHFADPMCVQRRLSASLRSNLKSMALCLCLGLLGAGCGPTQADNAVHAPNPMFNQHYSHGKEVLWVDYENAISMHPVITSRPKERRQQRLDTPSPLDNRISYGCINVPVQFFQNVIQRMFSGTDGIVYVLPENNAVAGNRYPG